jgi:hypothetical protein
MKILLYLALLASLVIMTSWVAFSLIGGKTGEILGFIAYVAILSFGGMKLGGLAKPKK